MLIDTELVFVSRPFLVDKDRDNFFFSVNYIMGSHRCFQFQLRTVEHLLKLADFYLLFFKYT